MLSRACFLGAILLTVLPAARADEALADFRAIDLRKIAATDAKVSITNSSLAIVTGHKDQNPGIKLAAPRGHWELSRFDHIAVGVKNTGRNVLKIACRVDCGKSNGEKNCNSAWTYVKPNESAVLKVQFERRVTIGIKLFGMRGYPPMADPRGDFDPGKITQVLIFVPQPAEDCAFELSDLRAAGAYVAPSTQSDAHSFFPFIDTFGQYVHADWPGKMHSLDELKQRRDTETKELLAKPGPGDWDQYGGWKTGPTLKATGFFRTEKYRGKWWLVDPEGRLFFSHGIDGVRMSEATPIQGRDGWFKEFPGDQAGLSEFIRTNVYVLKGHYAGNYVKCYSFAAANLKRKYGPDWQAIYPDMAHKRLRSWGLNTVGNWSDASMKRGGVTPYATTINFNGKKIEGSGGYWGKFRDVFDEEFKRNINLRMEQERNGSAKDPWCIGYFVDNELSWGDENSLGLAALLSPPDQAAKKVFVADLRAKYVGIDRLNSAWGAKYASWDDLLKTQTSPDKARAKQDLADFYRKTADTYFRTIRQAVKAAAPNHLYLGCRFAWVNPLAVEAAAKYCDVVSYNLYRSSVADFRLPINADVPLIIGEFHFGALDRGMFHPGLMKTASQQERAARYKQYVQDALKHPQFVGTHWFQYQDQPTIGRSLDEENYQIGFVDIADTPYRETIEACREVGYDMYKLRAE